MATAYQLRKREKYKKLFFDNFDIALLISIILITLGLVAFVLLAFFGFLSAITLSASTIIAYSIPTILAFIGLPFLLSGLSVLFQFAKDKLSEPKPFVYNDHATADNDSSYQNINHNLNNNQNKKEDEIIHQPETASWTVKIVKKILQGPVDKICGYLANTFHNEKVKKAQHQHKDSSNTFNNL